MVHTILVWYTVSFYQALTHQCVYTYGLEVKQYFDLVN